jgi:hypothetical protein
MLAAGMISQKESIFKPGSVITSPRHDILRRLELGGSGSIEAFREIDSIKSDIDETNKTSGNIRGLQAQVGRVSATEAQSRVTHAHLPLKVTAAMIAEDLLPYIKMVPHMYLEMGLVKNIEEATGDGLPVPPEAVFRETDFKFLFKGPGNAVNREGVSMQLKQVFQQYGQWLGPKEVRELMKLDLDMLEIPGASKIVTAEHTQLLTQQAQQQMSVQSGQMQQAQQQQQAGQDMAQTQGDQVVQGQGGEGV